MRTITFVAFLFFSISAHTADIHTQCKKIKTELFKIPHRIDDKDLQFNQKQIIWRSCDIKNGECLYKRGSHQCQEVKAVYGTDYAQFNSLGYNEYYWAIDYPNTPSPSEFNYCRNTEGLNPPEINNLLQIFDHYAYVNCDDKYGDYKGSGNFSNVEGCFWFEYKEQEIITYEPCTIYRCLETDIIEGDSAPYTCQVFCAKYNRPSQWSYHRNAYACEHLPIDDAPPESPECYGSKVEAWDCFGDKISNTIFGLNNNILSNLDTLNYNLYDTLNVISQNQNNQSDDQQNNAEQPETPPSYEFENVEVPFINHEVTQFLQNLFPTQAQCPSDNTLNIMGAQYKFSYSELCGYLALLSNFVMIFAIYFSYRLLRSL